MPPVQICPPDEVLRDWLLGTARGKDAEAVGEHLLECQPCGVRLERLVASDPLLMNARAAGGTNSASDDGTLADEILRRIKAPPGQSTPNAELAFLALPLPPYPTDLGTLGRYRVLELLGQGGMGMVFRAVDTNLNRTVALKVILPKYAANEKLRARFLEEGRATARVRSAHVAEVYDCDVIDGVPFLTMELLVGMTLDKKPKPMPVDQWRKFGYSIAKGLADAHRAGLIHRDLKPSNIHLGADARTGKPTVKIIDFGLARPVERATEVTGTGEMLGTPAYMSPEQARSKPNIDHRTDLYALGVILFQLATGKLPYASAHEGVFSLLAELASADPLPGVRTAVPDMPADLAGLIDRLLAKNPANRPASADEVMAVLKASVGNTTTTVTKPVVAAKELSVDPVSVFAPSMTDVDAIPVPRPAPETQPFVEIDDAEPRMKPAKRRPVWPFAVAGLLAFVLIGVLASGVLKVRTKDGTIELTDLTEDAEVLVDGTKLTVTWDKGKQKAEVHVPPGTHRVEVKKEGFTTKGEEVTLSDGGRKIFTARLEKAPVVVPLPSGELVRNGDCTTPSLDGWKTIKGNWYKSSPKEHFFCAGDCQEGILQQDVDVSRYAARIDGGEVDFKVGVQFSSFDNDTSLLKMLFLDKDNKELAVGYDTGEHAHRGAWVPYGKTTAPPAGTRTVRIILRSRLVPRPGNKHNTGYFDDVSLKAVERSAPPLRTTIGYETLFNGKDLTGWTVEGGETGVWKVDRGTIVATAAAPQTPSFLLSDKAYADFSLRFHFQVADTAAVGGVALRAIGGERTRGNNGLVSNHPLLTLTNPSAGDFTGTGWFLKAAVGNVRPAAKPQVVVGQWHTAEVTVRGDTCVASFDGVPCVDLRFDPTAPPADGFPAGLQRAKGRIGFKTFTGALNYRNIEIRELTPATAVPQIAAAPPGSPLRYFGYSIQADAANVAKVAGYTNVLVDATWRRSEEVLNAARQAKIGVVLEMGNALEQTDKLFALIEKHRDVVAGVGWWNPYFNKGNSPEQVAAFGRTVKDKFPGLQFWVSVIEGAHEGAVPDEVDAILVGIYYDTSPAAVHAKADGHVPQWVAKAGNRPVLLRWSNWDDANRGPGIAGRTQAGTMKAAVEAAKKHKLAGVLFDQLGTVPGFHVQGIDTNPALVPEVEAAAKELGFGKDRTFFNGKDLAGWDGVPGYWHVENGALVSRIPADNPKHTFLISDKKYKDFDLKFQARRLDGVGNTGVQFRSRVTNAEDRVVVGPQVEVDAAEFDYPPGSLVTEPDLIPLKEKARPEVKADYKNAEFNAFHVRCVGKHVTIKVNGVTAIDGDYDLPDEGVIAWQIHGKRGTKETTFRDIEFTDLSAAAPPPASGFVPPAGFTALFNGKDKLGWTRDGGEVGQWDVADGALVGTSDDYPNRCYLLTEKEFSDFTLTFDFKLGDDRSHGGVALRAVLGEKVPFGVNSIFDHPLIKLTNANQNLEDGTGANHWLRDAAPFTKPAVTPRVVVGQWHTARVTVQGDKCTATVDGLPTVNIQLDPTAKSDGNFIPGLKRAKGRVGFQVNTGRMAYRNVAIQELTAPPVDKRAKFALGGKIVREGDELSILPEKLPDNAAVTFGDPAWTDYDVEVDAKGNAWIYFHVTDVANFWDFEAVPDANGYKCQIAIKSEGKFKPVADAAKPEASTADGWNRMKVSVRGNLAIGYFNGREVVRHTDARNPAGMVSLGAFQGEARYKNLTVTAANGTALFQGLPELSAAPAVPVVAVPKGDPFVACTFWRGVKVIDKGESVGTYFYELEVKERVGNTFTGSAVEVGIDNPTSVSGTIDGTLLTWTETPLRPNSSHISTTVKGNRTGSVLNRLTTAASFKGGKTNSGYATLFRVAGPGEDTTDFHPIFDGRTKAGWGLPAGQPDHWAVKDGKLVGRNGGISHLYTMKDYTNVHLICRAKINAGGNSGVYFRSTFGPVRGTFPNGLEAQISCALPAQPTGSLFHWGQLEKTKVGPDPVKANDWFDMECIVQGNRTRISINGKEMMDFLDRAPLQKTGRIALQLHDAKTEVEFALIAVKELKP